MQIKTGRISFNSDQGSGPRDDFTEVTLDAPASQATAILTGFNAAYSPADDDHHLGNLEVRLSAQFVNMTPSQLVRVTAVFGLRDWSGDWDDKYEGTVDFAVLAE
jgi:hypothetical protein